MIFFFGVLLFVIEKNVFILFRIEVFKGMILSDKYKLMLCRFFWLFDCRFSICILLRFVMIVFILCEVIISFSYFGSFCILDLSMFKILVLLLFEYLFKVLIIMY